MPQDQDGGGHNFQNKLREQLLNRVNALIDQALNALAQDQTEEAYRAILRAKEFKIPAPHLAYVHAICLVKMNKLPEAAEALQSELSQFPGNGEAETLLNDVRAEQARPITAQPTAQLRQPGSFQSPQFAGSALPIHFFTIVLNGLPFIKHHLAVFEKLNFPWHWHIVEGVAQLTHCTAWSAQNGGHISPELHSQGRSLDGTSQYLDQIGRLHPEHVSVYRKPPGQFWDGKIEMVNAPLGNIKTSALLWQVDADELWLPEQIAKTRELFQANPEKTAAYYFCHYFVGEDLLISSRNTYGNNSSYEWLRTWRFEPGCRFAAHEPPRLGVCTPDGRFIDLAAINPFSHQETEKAGLIFQHFAYVIKEQLRFKESYYGYRDAVANWQKLQENRNLPALLKNYLPWVTDQAVVTSAQSQNVRPLARRNAGGEWEFSI